MEVLISKIKLPDAMMRTVVDEAGLESLARSIRKLGVVIPLIVRKVEKGFELVAGFRRLMAAEMVGLSKVPVLVRESDDREAEAVKTAENREREDVNAVDEGVYYVAVMERMGWNQKDLAQELGVSEGLVSQRIKTTAWDDYTKDQVRKGNLKFSVARELEQIRDEVEKRRLVKVAVTSGVTPGVAAEWRRQVNHELDTQQERLALDRSRKVTHQPQKVYVTCQTCEAAVEVDKVVFLRICTACHEIVRGAI